MRRIIPRLHDKIGRTTGCIVSTLLNGLQKACREQNHTMRYTGPRVRSVRRRFRFH